MSADVRITPGWQRNLEGPMRGALDRLGGTIAGNAARMAPVRTGELRNSIGHEVRGDSVYVYAGARHGIYVELGTYKMSAQPYLRPAVESVGGRFFR